MSSQATSLPLGQKLGTWTVGKKLGNGEFGAVYTGTGCQYHSKPVTDMLQRRTPGLAINSVSKWHTIPKQSHQNEIQRFEHLAVPRVV